MKELFCILVFLVTKTSSLPLWPWCLQPLQNCKNLDPYTKVCGTVVGQIGTWSVTGTGELGTVKFSLWTAGNGSGSKCRSCTSPLRLWWAKPHNCIQITTTSHCKNLSAKPPLYLVCILKPLSVETKKLRCRKTLFLFFWEPLLATWRRYLLLLHNCAQTLNIVFHKWEEREWFDFPNTKDNDFGEKYTSIWLCC